MKNIDVYLKKSHEFALKQLLERFLFEININKELFNEDINLEKLIRDTSNNEIFTYNEYKKIYKAVLNKINK